jgi:hypothetical protein
MCGVSCARLRQGSVERIFEYGFIKGGEIHVKLCNIMCSFRRRTFTHVITHLIDYFYVLTTFITASLHCHNCNRIHNHRHYYLFEYFPNLACFI